MQVKTFLFVVLTILSSSVVTEVKAWSASNRPNRDNACKSRRSILLGIVPTTVVVGAAIVATSTSAQALDMDAFIQRELSSEVCDDKLDKKCQPKLSDDQALCRFGQPSQETGEACLRANMSTKRSTGVDAFGKVDRGEYLRCKAKYVDDKTSNKLVKEWNCQ